MPPSHGLTQKPLAVPPPFSLASHMGLFRLTGTTSSDDEDAPPPVLHPRVEGRRAVKPPPSRDTPLAVKTASPAAHGAGSATKTTSAAAQTLAKVIAQKAALPLSSTGASNKSPVAQAPPRRGSPPVSVVEVPDDELTSAREKPKLPAAGSVLDIAPASKPGPVVGTDIDMQEPVQDLSNASDRNDSESTSKPSDAIVVSSDEEEPDVAPSKTKKHARVDSEDDGSDSSSAAKPKKKKSRTAVHPVRLG
ncbi:hypothetical protein EXIGLDRAFT_766419 [Exidia glandulosa HHB12029]|uniref:Uncharacterized protein n=1 Tax=Exidia glandulosa HHB12029 TaxID=1314781 RepID=A0A165JT04_EXIGL|nr:hypothetical protein EXIGLDRAFT_766419 [Exidia glandulosa HHB12029]